VRRKLLQLGDERREDERDARDGERKPNTRDAASTRQPRDSDSKDGHEADRLGRGKHPATVTSASPV